MLLRLARGFLSRAQAGGKRGKENASLIADDLLLRRFFSSSSSSSSSQNDKGSSNTGHSESSPSPSSGGWHEITIDRAGPVGGSGGGEDDKGSTSTAADEPATAAATSAAAARSLAASLPLPPPLETPMTRHIKALIQFRGGPITVAEFMKECLTNPTAGYYTTRAKEKKTEETKEEEEERERSAGAGDENKPSSSSPASSSSASSKPGSGVFGPRGDFVTSPDISQLMGDCVGVWLASEWLAFQKEEEEEEPSKKKTRNSKVRIVELGPGRGTLLSDALRALAPLSRRGLFASEVEVELVEVSAALRRAQWASLKCRRPRRGGASSSPSDDGGEAPDEEPQEATSALFEEAAAASRSGSSSGGGGIRVTWRSRLEEVPSSCSPSSPSSNEDGDAEEEEGKAVVPTFYLAHEFFDALPVHQFVRVAGRKPPRGGLSGGGAGSGRVILPPGGGNLGGGGSGGIVLPTSAAWRERLVDVAEASNSYSSSPHLRFVLSPGETPASRWLLPRRLELMESEEQRRSTTELEVSGEGMAVAAALGARLSASDSSSPGSALIIDYGRASPPYGDSLVAIREHRPVADVLSSAGEADLSVRVDFGALAAAAVEAGRKGGAAAGGGDNAPSSSSSSSSSSSVRVFGPISQSDFLRGLGIAARLEALVGAAEAEARAKGDGGSGEGESETLSPTLEETIESLVEGARRLVAPDSDGGLGDTYQAMVLSSAAGRGGEAPVPFGGSV